MNNIVNLKSWLEVIEGYEACKDVCCDKMHHSFKEFNTTLCLKKRANFGKLLFRHGLILSMTFCDNMLVACPRVSEALLQQLVSQRLVSRTGVCTMHTRSCISPQSVGNWIV